MSESSLLQGVFISAFTSVLAVRPFLTLDLMLASAWGERPCLGQRKNKVGQFQFWAWQWHVPPNGKGTSAFGKPHLLYKPIPEQMQDTILQKRKRLAVHPRCMARHQHTMHFVSCFFPCSLLPRGGFASETTTSLIHFQYISQFWMACALPTLE